MDNFDLKKYLAENKLEEGTPHQFGSDSARDLAMAKAKLSNAILELDSDDLKTAKAAVEAYLILGDVLKAHLADRFKSQNYK